MEKAESVQALKEICVVDFCLTPEHSGENTKEDVDINLLGTSQNNQCVSKWI